MVFQEVEAIYWISQLELEIAIAMLEENLAKTKPLPKSSGPL
jgi:hypothetical protein